MQTSTSLHVALEEATVDVWKCSTLQPYKTVKEASLLLLSRSEQSNLYFGQQLGVWLDKAFTLVKGLPRYLVPCYFDAIVTPLYLKLLQRSWTHMSRYGF